MAFNHYCLKVLKYKGFTIKKIKSVEISPNYINKASPKYTENK